MPPSPLSQQVVFNVSSNGGNPQYLAAYTNYSSFGGMYGLSDWSYEAWVLHTGYANGGESPVFQWGPRPATACQGGHTSVGYNGAYGAGGHYVSSVI